MGKKKAPAVRSGGLRSLSDLDPVTRMEAILDGEDISPATREEYFVKKAVTTASSELPAVTSSDNGDVLTVVNGAWAKAEAPSGLPEVTAADNGDVLTVVSGEWAKATPSAAGEGFTIAGFFDATTAPEVPAGKSVLDNSYKCEARYEGETVECIWIEDPELLPIYLGQSYGPVMYYINFLAVAIGDIFELNPVVPGGSLTDVVLTVKPTATCYGQVTVKSGLDEAEYYLIGKNDVEWIPASSQE